jgi:predicted SAM-dependent methyltransferase
MNWEEVKTKSPIYLNLGGNGNSHPKISYENYIAVDINPPNTAWAVKHDLRNPIPLQNNSVDRILSEDFFEHVAVEEIKEILRECFRILKQGGLIRIGVPDYNNPKDRPYLKKGKDPRFPLHITLTHYDLIKEIINAIPFKHYKFYHYWDGDKFIYNKIDYSIAMVKRTPDNDIRCKRIGIFQNVIGIAKDFLYILSKGFKVPKNEFLSLKEHRLHVTSLVVDLFKD